MKKALVFVLLSSLIFAVCQSHAPDPSITDPNAISATENSTAESKAPPNEPTVSSIQSVTEATETGAIEKSMEPPQTAQPQTQKQDEQAESAAEETKAESQSTESSTPEVIAPQQEETILAETTAEEPPSSQPVTEDEVISETTAPVETTPPEPEINPPTEETTPETESEPEEEPEPFDIASWVSFAKSYTQSIGLNLDASAGDYWDNPITAGSHCIYLERDICNRQNPYNADGGITDVWIWAVDIGGDCYDLYIG